MPQMMTTKEVAEYLKLHEITVCKYAADGKIPAIRIGRSGALTRMRLMRGLEGDRRIQRDRRVNEDPPKGRCRGDLVS